MPRLHRRTKPHRQSSAVTLVACGLLIGAVCMWQQGTVQQQTTFIFAAVVAAALVVVASVNRVLTGWFERRQYLKAIADFRWRKGMTPLEFETCCSDYLTTRGWKSATTKGSGDQGVDVCASKRGTRIVIQCKLYSKPVGNKAVQEAHAGKAFVGAHRAAVVSNQGYTKAARELSLKTGVLLLHFTDLAMADELFDIA